MYACYWFHRMVAVILSFSLKMGTPSHCHRATAYIHRDASWLFCRYRGHLMHVHECPEWLPPHRLRNKTTLALWAKYFRKHTFNKLFSFGSPCYVTTGGSLDLHLCPFWVTPLRGESNNEGAYRYEKVMNINEDMRCSLIGWWKRGWSEQWFNIIYVKELTRV